MRYLSLPLFLVAALTCSAQANHQSEADSLGYGTRFFHLGKMLLTCLYQTRYRFNEPKPLYVY